MLAGCSVATLHDCRLSLVTVTKKTWSTWFLRYRLKVLLAIRWLGSEPTYPGQTLRNESIQTAHPGPSKSYAPSA